MSPFCSGRHEGWSFRVDGRFLSNLLFSNICNSYAFGNNSTDYLKRYRCLIDEPDSEESVILLEKLHLPQGKKAKKLLDGFLHSLYDALVLQIWSI